MAKASINFLFISKPVFTKLNKKEDSYDHWMKDEVFPENEPDSIMEEVKITSILVPYAERQFNWMDFKKKDEASRGKCKATPHIKWSTDVKFKK
jgi:hypothetical protein